MSHFKIVPKNQEFQENTVILTGCCKDHSLQLSNLGEYVQFLLECQRLDEHIKIHFFITCVIETCKAIMAQKFDCQCDAKTQLRAYFDYASENYGLFLKKLDNDVKNFLMIRSDCDEHQFRVPNLFNYTIDLIYGPLDNEFKVKEFGIAGDLSCEMIENQKMDCCSSLAFYQFVVDLCGIFNALV